MGHIVYKSCGQFSTIEQLSFANRRLTIKMKYFSVAFLAIALLCGVKSSEAGVNCQFWALQEAAQADWNGLYADLEMLSRRSNPPRSYKDLYENGLFIECGKINLYENLKLL